MSRSVGWWCGGSIWPKETQTMHLSGHPAVKFEF